jgi:hypothetical protein
MMTCQGEEHDAVNLQSAKRMHACTCGRHAGFTATVPAHQKAGCEGVPARSCQLQLATQALLR